MIAIIAAAALSAAQPAATPATAPDPVATLAEVQDMYNQSCQVKAYAAYDDLCEALRKRIRDAERDADKAAANQRRAAKATPKPADSTLATAAK